MGAKGSSQKAPGPFGRVIRDLLMPFFLKRVSNEAQKWLYDYSLT
jgi:hypothetical protein